MSLQFPNIDLDGTTNAALENVRFRPAWSKIGKVICEQFGSSNINLIKTIINLILHELLNIKKAFILSGTYTKFCRDLGFHS